jgi:hypothetical protein
VLLGLVVVLAVIWFCMWLGGPPDCRTVQDVRSARPCWWPGARSAEHEMALHESGEPAGAGLVRGLLDAG